MLEGRTQRGGNQRVIFVPFLNDQEVTVQWKN
eukprot:SAG11_NODE_26057_length_350_cov_1.027888_2_plen_31_part_01